MCICIQIYIYTHIHKYMSRSTHPDVPNGVEAYIYSSLYRFVRWLLAIEPSSVVARSSADAGSSFFLFFSFFSSGLKTRLSYLGPNKLTQNRVLLPVSVPARGE